MFNRHFHEFIALLESHGVEYLVVGGYAVGFHGFPRYTGDLDVFIATSESNAHRLLSVFTAFGFGDLGLNADDFMQSEMIIEIGREPLKIQVLTGIDGVTFEECYQERVRHEEGSLVIPFIGIECLLKNKAASPRAKDRIDLDELRRLHLPPSP